MARSSTLRLVRASDARPAVDVPSVGFDPRRRLDPETLHELRRGDRRTTERALRALQPEVRSRLARLLGPRIDLDDAVQETLIEVVRAFATFEGRATPSTLANRVAVRVAYRYFGRAPVEAWDQEPPAEGGDPEELLLQRRTAAKLYRCVEKLSAKRRMAFLLCEIEGLTPSEAAEVLEVPSFVVRARLMQARNELVRLLRGDPDVRSMLHSLRDEERAVEGGGA